MQNSIQRLKQLPSLIWKDIPGLNKPLKSVQKTLRVAIWTFREIGNGTLQLNAMSLAYITLLSLVPLLAVTFSVLKAFGAHNMIEPTLLALLEPLGEQAPKIAEQVTGFVDSISVGVLGAVGIAVLFYTVINLMQKIEKVFNQIWQVQEVRALSTRFSSYLSVVMVGPVMIFAAGALSTALLTTPVIQNLSEITPFGQLIAWVTSITPILLVVVAFAFLYVFVPNTRVNLQAALIGGLVASVLWHTVGWAFASLVTGSANYSAIYSAFASLVLFMVWLQVAWMIVLLGSLVSYAWQNVEALSPSGDLIRLTPSEREALAIELTAAISRRFEEDQKPPTSQDLAKMFDLSVRVVMDVLRDLERDELIRQTESRPPAWLPARPPSHITLHQIMSSMRQDGVKPRFRLLSEAGRGWMNAQQRYRQEVLSRLTVSLLPESAEDNMAQQVAVDEETGYPNPHRGLMESSASREGATQDEASGTSTEQSTGRPSSHCLSANHQMAARP